LPPAKYERGNPTIHIGDEGPMGRLLVRGSYGHDIVEEVYPIEGEPIVDKPGKGAFYATDLDAILKMKGIKQLVVCGVTTEVCVHTSVREANDRGYDALVLSDAVGSYFPEFQRVALEMIKAQGGIFGWVSDSERFLRALGSATGSTPAVAGVAVG
jgi:nicotinamidase-related amidase